MAFDKFLPITRIALLTSCALGWGTAPLMAQASGTLAGEVRDAGSGRAIVGAQVYLVDTSIGSLTNGEGRVLLLNVPAGEHVVRAEYLGYRRVGPNRAGGSGPDRPGDLRSRGDRPPAG